MSQTVPSSCLSIKTHFFFLGRSVFLYKWTVGPTALYFLSLSSLLLWCWYCFHPQQFWSLMCLFSLSLEQISEFRKTRFLLLKLLYIQWVTWKSSSWIPKTMEWFNRWNKSSLSKPFTELWIYPSNLVKLKCFFRHLNCLQDEYGFQQKKKQMSIGHVFCFCTQPI